MMQRSVYSKLALNNVATRAIRAHIAKNLPPEGTVELLEITENQFSRIEYLVGEAQTTVIDSMDRVVEL